MRKNREALLHFCKCQYQLYEVPIRVFENGKLIARFDNYDIGDFEESRNATIVKTMERRDRQDIVFGIQASLLQDGAVFEKKGDLFLYVGPARGVSITVPIARRYFETLGVLDHLEEQVQKFLLYMNSLPVIAPGLFVVILSALNAFLNDEVVEPGSIFAHNTESAPDPVVNTEMLTQREERYFGSNNTPNAVDMEKRFLFCVKNGMVKELRELCEATSGFEILGSAESPDAWRMTKDRCIVGVAITSRTAMSAGLPPLEASQLCDLYIQKAELCTTAEGLNRVRYDMLLDFTERVRDLNFHGTENQLVQQVANFILEHLEEPISLATLAENFDVNKNYLCSVFRREIGMSVTEYIQRHKINIAKQMLRFTDKSLIEIANYLSFCSQSYFQQVFRKVTGVTPTAYRNGKRDSEKTPKRE